MLDNIRHTLEKARTTIGNGWTKGAFFEQPGTSENTNGQEYTVCLAGGVMAALDMLNADEDVLWTTPSGRGAIEALYTHIPLRSPARRYAEKNLIECAKTLGHHDPDQQIQDLMREYATEFYNDRMGMAFGKKELRNPQPGAYQSIFDSYTEQFHLPDRSEGECKNCYSHMLGAITKWNDTDSRRKTEVLDLVDASIKDTIRKMEAI